MAGNSPVYLGQWGSSPLSHIHCSVDSMVGVRGALSVQERNASPTVSRLHSELNVGIHLIKVVEWDVPLVIFSYAEYIIYKPLPPKCGDGALGSQCQFFKIFHINICYESTYLFHQAVGMGHWGPSASSSKFSMYIFPNHSKYLHGIFSMISKY